MKLFGRELEGFAKALVILVAVLLVALGMCGVTGAIEAKKGWNLLGPGLPNTAAGDVLTVLDLSAFVAGWISAVGVALVMVLWPISAVYKRITKPDKDRVQRIFDNIDDSESGDRR